MTINPLSSYHPVDGVLPPPQASTGILTPANDPVDQPALSPLARLQNLLQLIQSNRSDRFSQVTTQIAEKLQAAAKKADDNGHSRAAGELTRLAGEFQKASETGQPPSLWALRNPGRTLYQYHQAQAGDTTAIVSQSVMDAAQSAGLG